MILLVKDVPHDNIIRHGNFSDFVVRSSREFLPHGLETISRRLLIEVNEHRSSISQVTPLY